MAVTYPYLKGSVPNPKVGRRLVLTYTLKTSMADFLPSVPVSTVGAGFLTWDGACAESNTPRTFTPDFYHLS
jgi:hypothetical protein